MTLDYPQYDNGMYRLNPPDYDNIALKLLRDYLPAGVDSIREVDINFLIKDCFYLDIFSKRLSADKSVLGLIAFFDSKIPCYNLKYEPSTFDVIAGNIVIDLSLSGQVALPRRRFTLAHELSHWILHRCYHSPTNQVFAYKKAGYLSCGDSSIEVRKQTLKTPYDREEWQANSLAAAILMPKIAFLSCAHNEMRKNFGAETSTISSKNDVFAYNATVGNIASTFNVSFQATEIRLEQLGILD